MNLGQLIKKLEKLPADLTVRHGFHHPHSYRGFYDRVAFEPKEHITIGEMLACAREAVGAVYDGYKGGSYKMDESTWVYIAYYGNTSAYCDECGRGLPAILVFLNNIVESNTED